MWTGTISSAITRQLAKSGHLKRAVPGFCAATRLDEGVRRCVDYLLSHPELQIEDLEFDAWCNRVIDTLEQAKVLFKS